MRLHHRLQPKRRKIVYAVTIEYREVDQRPLSMHSRSSNELSSDELRRDVARVIECELPADLEEIFGIRCKAEVIAWREGSLTAFFGVALAGYGFIAAYKDFFDSLELIREHCDHLLDRLVARRYRNDFTVGVSLKHPRSASRYRKRFPPGMLEELLGGELLPPPAVPRGRRDGFFWFLLVLSVLLIAVLGVLVGGAVLKTYFP